MSRSPTSVGLVALSFATAIAVGACAPKVHTGSAASASSSTSLDASTNPRLLTEHTWSLATLDGTPITVPSEQARPSLSFDSSTHRASGMAGVNRFSGPYASTSSTLKLESLMTTKMAGPPELNALERRFLRALEETTGWRIDRGELELLVGDKALARFAPAH